MPDLGILKVINLRMQWEHEDEDFTPWLSKNLPLLNDALNMNLKFDSDHVKVGRYECDMLCRNTNDHSFVVIENQLDGFDHDHLGKALVYTAGLNARTVIWIAENFTNEHQKTLNWLNESTHDCLQFFGVKLELIQIDESRYAPKFNIVIKPNHWLPPLVISNNYWSDFNAYLKQHRSHLEVLRWNCDPEYLGFYLGYGENNDQHPDYWISAGKSNGFIAANFCLNKGRLPNIERRFENHKQDIDRIFTEEFEEELQRPDNRYVVVGVRKWLNNQVDQNSEFEWFRERLEKLDRLFKQGGKINFLSDEGF